MSHVFITEAPSGVHVASVADLQTPDLKVVSFLPQPKDSTVTGVASNVLRALGNDPNVNGKAQHTSDVNYLMPIWLTAHRTETLYAIAPQHCHPNSLKSLVRLCSATPTNLVFAVDHGYLLRFARDLAYAMPTIINWPNTDALHHSEEEAHVGWDPDHRDLMPTDDYLTFYAECERSLPPTMFTEVHNLYVDSLNRTLQWIETIGANDFNIDDVKRAMAVLTGEQTNISEALVALRGAQAAFHRNGWLLKYEDSVILYGVLRFPPSAPTLSQWRALRAYRNPHPAASIALYLCGMTVSEINQITVSDLAAWHATGEPIGTTDINPEAEPYLRAHLYNLLGSNPDPNRLALGAIKANGQTSTKVRAAIREAATKLGTSIGDAVTLTDVSRDNRHIGNKTFELERLG